ncbi:MAG TPA: hypothetical protein PK289_08730 [Bacteroidia bacterium]|nr:hypothetical protein [Bacteroidia bacterium]HRG54031.1 hypothetical protein [Bacteroidia bacterium]
MKAQFFKLVLAVGLLEGTNLFAQELPSPSNFCNASEVMAHYYQSNPEAVKERAANEKFTQEFIAHPEKFERKNAVARRKYVIPCVFHVYGTTQGGKQ